MADKRTQALLKTLLLLMVTYFPAIVLAQDPGGGPDAPIDGGLSLLLAAGTAYGVKKYRVYKKNIIKKGVEK